MKQRRSRRGFGVLFWLLAAAVVVLGVRFASDRYYRMAYPVEYQALVEQYCQEFSVEPALCYAVIRTESSFNPEATSTIGARGLMQLTEETFDWIKLKIAPSEDLTFDDLYDPETNIRFGTYFVSYCLLRYHDDLATAAAAYHSGWGTVDNLLSQAEYSSDGETLDHYPYPQMRLYVRKITNSYQRYQDIYNEK